jgi:hypothetical protein
MSGGATYVSSNGEAVRGDWLACWPRLSIFTS